MTFLDYYGKGYNKNTESNKDIDYLLNSAAIGDVEGVKFFIEHCNVDVNSTDSDVNTQDNDGITPLYSPSHNSPKRVRYGYKQ